MFRRSRRQVLADSRSVRASPTPLRVQVSHLHGGDVPGVDTSDGAGMNMMDLQAQAWSAPLLEAIAPGEHNGPYTAPCL